MLVDQRALDRANICQAWQFADRMTADDFEELCRVTVAQLHHDAGGPESSLDQVRAYGA
jgi:hypothetical protein